MNNISKREHQIRLNLYNQGFNDKEIGDILSLSKESICSWRNGNNLLSYCENNHKKRLELYNEGLSDREIGNIIGEDSNTIKGWRLRKGLTYNKNIYTKTLKLYNQGLSDSKIAKKIGKTKHDIIYWRTKNKLPLNNFILTKEEQHKKRLELYNEGLSDSKIAIKVGVSKEAIHQWRTKNNLLTKHLSNLTKENQNKRLELYNQGLKDKEISSRSGVSTSTIQRWRVKNNLSINKKIKEYTRLELYNKGLTDKEISVKLGCKRKTIYSWRKNNKLVINTPENKKLNNKILDRITYNDYKLIRTLYNKGMNDKEISKNMNIKPSLIRIYRDVLELGENKPVYNISLYEHNIMLSLYYEGLTDTEIGKQIGKDYNYVYMWRKDNKLLSNSSIIYFKKNEKVMSLEDVHKLYNNGFGEQEIREIISIRKKFKNLLYIDIEEATIFSNDMKNEEGGEFTELCLNGIIEKDINWKPDIEETKKLTYKKNMKKNDGSSKMKYNEEYVLTTRCKSCYYKFISSVRNSKERCSCGKAFKNGLKYNDWCEEVYLIIKNEVKK